MSFPLPSASRAWEGARGWVMRIITKKYYAPLSSFIVLYRPDFDLSTINFQPSIFSPGPTTRQYPAIPGNTRTMVQFLAAYCRLTVRLLPRIQFSCRIKSPWWPVRKDRLTQGRVTRAFAPNASSRAADDRFRHFSLLFCVGRKKFIRYQAVPSGTSRYEAVRPTVFADLRRGTPCPAPRAF
jgi:hypothetical protein